MWVCRGGGGIVFGVGKVAAGQAQRQADATAGPSASLRDEKQRSRHRQVHAEVRGHGGGGHCRLRGGVYGFEGAGGDVLLGEGGDLAGGEAEFEDFGVGDGFGVVQAAAGGHHGLIGQFGKEQE